MEAAMETRVVPGAFRRAEAVRGVGLGLTGALSVLSGVLLAALVTAMSIAAGEGVGPFLPDLAAVAVLAAYLALAPPLFARLTRVTTADATARRLLAVLAGYAVGWSALLLVVDRF